MAIWKEYHFTTSHKRRRLESLWASSHAGFGRGRVMYTDPNLDWVVTNLSYRDMHALARMDDLRLPEPITMTDEEAANAWEQIRDHLGLPDPEATR